VQLEHETLKKLHILVRHRLLALGLIGNVNTTLLLAAESILLGVQPGKREHVHPGAENFVEFKPVPAPACLSLIEEYPGELMLRQVLCCLQVGQHSFEDPALLLVRQHVGKQVREVGGRALAKTDNVVG